MIFEIKIGSEYKDTTVTITGSEITDEIKKLIYNLSARPSALLIGLCGANAYIINPDNVCRFVGQGKKIYAVMGEKEYALRKRLYELEQTLDPRYFVRISKSEIINLRKVTQIFIDKRALGFELSDGKSAYTSRDYTDRVKTVLGL